MRRALVAVLLLVALVVAGPLAGSSMAAGTEPADPPPVTVNEFFPQDRSLSDCLSALPKPGCGSEARGGMHQTAVFAALMLGLLVIGTRVVFAIRRRDAADVPDEQPQR
ncbi:MAG: hypothetical protein EA389_15445 [Ilumatobacter sp.]|nr:MAG: hypothetical protein EA389_15445 [Ilumatobacter sp.]